MPRLPHGRRDFFRQVAIWLGFALAYEFVRASAEPGRADAIRNAKRIVRLESGFGGLYELDVQRWTLDAGSVLLRAVNWTYWLSQFAVLSAVLLWIYVYRNHMYLRLRNALFAVNTVGLIGFVLVPTAPPRLLPYEGFVDTVSASAVTFNSEAVRLLANPYAAMPSLHAADALVVGVVLASVIERRALRAIVLLWPLWVSFTLVASGNHFLLDVFVGAVLGATGLAATTWWAARRPSAYGPRVDGSAPGLRT